MSSYQAVVVGAGINGLCAAYQLARRGVTRLALVEQFELGHERGSSHGQTRITRSSYHTPRYIELVARAHRESWPQLEERVGESLRLPTPGCFFGPGLERYLESLRQVPEVLPWIEVLEAPQARQRFPCFRFPDSPLVVHDRSAAVIRAQRTRQALAGLLLEGGVSVWEGCQVLGIDSTAGGLEVRTTRGRLEGERLVLTAGPWSARLVEELRGPVRAARQHVGYFRVQAPPEARAVGTFPVWVYTAGPQESFYGLPEYGREGLKVARHRTGPAGDDPDETAQAMPDAARQDLLEFLEEQFAWPAEDLCGAELCFYSNTPEEDFILDQHPQEPRLIVGAGFSGHGFKFGPLTGQILAELALDGRSSIEEFERHRDHFRLAQAPPW